MYTVDQDEMKLVLVNNYYLAGKINQLSKIELDYIETPVTN